MPTSINFHHYKNDPQELVSDYGDNWQYVGRENKTHGFPQSPLANPFVTDASKRGIVVSDPIKSYKQWLWRKIIERDTAVIKEMAHINQETGLLCWCAPEPCHADVIASAWEYLRCGQYDGLPSDLPTKTLSIKQPWAWLITRPDVIHPEERGALFFRDEIKTVENRTWSTDYRGTFLIHAGRQPDAVGYRYVLETYQEIPLPPLKELETAGVVGMAVLLDCLKHHGSRWKVAGQYGFSLMSARPLPYYECPGQLKFFEVDYGS